VLGIFASILELTAFCLGMWITIEGLGMKFRNNIAGVQSKIYSPVQARIDSWTSVPFVDVIVLDAAENPLGCPESHPDDLIFEVWPGTTGMCDCLESEGHRAYYLNMRCSRGEGPHDSSDCKSVEARNPIIQNIVKGARYCGRRGGKSFAEAIRPIRDM